LSNFLLNLARRSAGLAPAVRARVTPGMGSADDAGTASAPPTTLRTPPSTEPSAADSVPATPPVHLHVESGTPHVIAVTPAAPLPPAAEARHFEAPPTAIARAPLEPSRVSTTTILVPVPSPLPMPAEVVSQPIPDRNIADEPRSTPPALLHVQQIEQSHAAPELTPARRQTPVVQSEPAPQPRSVEAIRERTQVIERIIEPAAAIVPMSHATATKCPGRRLRQLRATAQLRVMGMVSNDERLPCDRGR
jgi:hypothetical protein